MDIKIVQGKRIVVKIAEDGQPLIVDGSAILICNGRIAEFAPARELVERFPQAISIGSDRHVVCPGFVNGHHHVGITPLQLGILDLPLELWLVSRLSSRRVDPYLDTLYSAIEMLESGVTTVQHLHVRAPRPVANVVSTARSIIKAYRDIGMRASYSFGLRNQNRFFYVDDKALLSRLPPEVAILAEPYFEKQTFNTAEVLDVFRTLYDEYAGDGLIKVQLAPVNLHWCSDDALLSIAETAREFAVPMHMHLVESKLQTEYARRRTGTTALKHLDRLGILGKDMTLGHCVWLTRDDMDLVAKTGTCICHNCSSNLRVRDGIAPLNEFRKRGITVALGIDEAGINDDRDMLQEMRLVLNLHRTPGLEESEVPSAAEVFEMATIGGAATTPFANQIGTLEPGMAADLVMFDWEKISFPYLSPDVPLLTALIQRARTSGVDYVMVAGEIVVRNGKLTRVDKQAILGEIASQMRLPLTEDELSNQTLGKHLLEEARRFYKEYMVGSV